MPEIRILIECVWLHTMQKHYNYFPIFYLSAMIIISLFHLCFSLCCCALFCWDRGDRDRHLRSALLRSPDVQQTSWLHFSTGTFKTISSKTHRKPSAVQAEPAVIWRNYSRSYTRDFCFRVERQVAGRANLLWRSIWEITKNGFTTDVFQCQRPPKFIV